jgi:hypothetical protein
VYGDERLDRLREMDCDTVAGTSAGAGQSGRGTSDPIGILCPRQRRGAVCQCFCGRIDTLLGETALVDELSEGSKLRWHFVIISQHELTNVTEVGTV